MKKDRSPFDCGVKRLKDFNSIYLNIFHISYFLRDTYSGMYGSTVLIPKVSKRGKRPTQYSSRENLNDNVLKQLYEGRLATKNAKFKYLQHLKQFLMKAVSQNF